jgi:hypothetical protein
MLLPSCLYLVCRIVAGDAHGVLEVLSSAAYVAASSALVPPKQAASNPLQLSVVEADAALASIVSPNMGRVPALAILAAVRRKAIADATTVLSRILAQHKKTLARSARVDAGDDDDDDDDDEKPDRGGADGGMGDEDRVDGGGSRSTLSFLDALQTPTSQKAFAAPVMSRNPRSQSLLRVDYGIMSPCVAHLAAVAAAVRRHTVAVSVPALSQCPFICLIDGTAEALLSASTKTEAAAPPLDAFSGVRSARGQPSSISGGLPGVLVPLAPVPFAALHLDTVFLGGTIDPEPPLPLRGCQVLAPAASNPAAAAAAASASSTATTSPPLGLGTLQRWMGSVLPVVAMNLSLVGRGGGGARKDDDDDEDAGGGGGVDFGLGGGADTALHPIVAAHLTAMGKRRLRPLPRGAEDAVVGYWRFERSDDELAAEKSRERELTRAGRWGPRAPAADTVAGLWGVSQAGEALSTFTAGGCIVDLSKHHSDGVLFDALALLARVKGAAAAVAASKGSAASPAGCAALGPSEIAAFVRVGFGSTVDAPFDQGDPAKVQCGRKAASICSCDIVP